MAQGTGKGYVIARAIVTDPVTWAAYGAAATPVMAQHGGRPIVRGGRCEVVEGEARARNAVLEFPSYDDALAYVRSESYGEVRRLRDGAGSIDMIVVEGA
ncbi:MAG: DUF1330 domain-containing protein [Pseudomonadota bacterium]